MFKTLVTVGFCALLGACATPARTSAMVATADNTAPVNAGLQRAILLGGTFGGEETSPLWTSEIGNPEFKEALQQSLELRGLLASGAGQYKLEATIMDVDQPLIGFDATVKTTVHYVLTEVATNKIVDDRTIEASHTATVSDAFVGVERLRLANEGAAKNNIAAYLDQLTREFKPSTASPTSQLESAVTLG